MSYTRVNEKNALVFGPTVYAGAYLPATTVQLSVPNRSDSLDRLALLWQFCDSSTAYKTPDLPTFELNNLPDSMGQLGSFYFKRNYLLVT